MTITIRMAITAFIIMLAIASGCTATAGGDCGYGTCTTPVATISATAPPAAAAATEIPRAADLSELALTDEELPFDVVSQMHSMLSGDSIDIPQLKGITGVYSSIYTGGRGTAAPGNALIQTVIECSPENASAVYYYLYREIPETLSGSNYLQVVEHTEIGDRSFAFTTGDISGPSGTYSMRGILFRKENIVEYLVLAYPKDDPVAITTIARMAAGKIPAGGFYSSAAATASPETTASAARPGPVGTATSGDGLLVWYDFEDDFPASGVVKDRSGNGRDGVVTGQVNRAAGIYGTGGIGFTGQGYLRTRDNPAAGRTQVTFSFWFRTDDPTRNYKFASAAEWHGGPGTGWTMATHRPEFWADDGPEDLLVPAQPNGDNHFVPDTWTHEAVVYDGSTMKEYTNGVLINDWQARNAPMSKGVPMAVGGWPQFSGYNYVGGMDDFRIYDRALSAEEISALAGVV